MTVARNVRGCLCPCNCSPSTSWCPPDNLQQTPRVARPCIQRYIFMLVPAGRCARREPCRWGRRRNHLLDNATTTPNVGTINMTATLMMVICLPSDLGSRSSAKNRLSNICCRNRTLSRWSTAPPRQRRRMTFRVASISPSSPLHIRIFLDYNFHGAMTDIVAR